MTATAPSRTAASASSGPVLSRRLILVLVGVLFVAKVVAFSTARADPTDFDCFHTVGRLAWGGRVEDAYAFRTLAPAIQADHGGRGAFLAFTYPPPIVLLLAPLGALPTGLGYLLFVGASLLAFLWVLRRAAGGLTARALATALPAILINVACGQNGLLTGTLIGFALLAGSGGRDGRAGLASGLMVIKPHLAVALAVHALAARRWTWAAVAVAIAAGVMLLSWGVFGPSAWTGFLHATREASTFLHARMFPLFRMVSVYASLRSAGAPELAAFGAQTIAALLALVGVARLAMAGTPRRAAGFAALAGVLVSPYAFDYDLTLFALGLVILWPDLERLASPAEQALIHALAAFGALYGIVKAALLQGLGILYDDNHPLLAPCGLAVAAAAWLVWRVLRRDMSRPAVGREERLA